MQYNANTHQQTIFNAAAVTSATQLPSNCTLHRNDIHCIYSGIDLSGSPNDLVFVSGNNTRRIRLYFPTAGNVIKQLLNQWNPEALQSSILLRARRIRRQHH